jgi:hypothetical protein
MVTHKSVRSKLANKEGTRKKWKQLGKRRRLGPHTSKKIK